MTTVENNRALQQNTSVVNRIQTDKSKSCCTSHATDKKSTPTRKALVFNELDSLKKARLQTFTNWPHFIPNRETMASNGWFYCQIEDRTLCIYCDTICQNWTNHDDPYEVHRRLAPHCIFIQSRKTPFLSGATSKLNNQNLTETFQPRHTNMCEIVRRIDSFNGSTWTQTSPNIESLALAGFFYSGTGNSVTCFYCNGSLHRWSENDDPKIEHARWFPACSYARHLCGDRLHANIQITKHQLTKEKENLDEETLNRLVSARLDLPIVERLRQEYKLSVIKRCIENQLKNNLDDFSSDYDLKIACLILQKQIDIINGKLENICTPSPSSFEDNDSMEISKKKLEECLICLTEERQLASMPCGHLCTCVPCGYALRTCPICREKIQSFVRVYC